MDQVIAEIRRQVPAALLPAFNNMLMGRSREHTREMAELVRWLHTCGRQAGVRTPNVDERSRDIGRPEYLDSLQLGEKQLYDAQGNHFNPEAVVLAWSSTLGDDGVCC